jgi:hypothetical protein
VTDCDPEALRVPVAAAVPDPVTLRVREPVAVPVGSLDALRLGLGDLEGEAFALKLPEGELVSEGVPDGDTLEDSEAVIDADGVSDVECEAEEEKEGWAVLLLVTAGVLVWLDDSELLSELVADALALALSLPVPEAVVEGVPVAEGLCVAAADAESVAEELGVGQMLVHALALALAAHSRHTPFATVEGAAVPLA